ncbi:hypothetical protein B4U80_12864 [Leptotrombidium deliense]|uniref:Protein kinase domain-containing protein n=1 Tax=Leptotrombidium deliense TaxID=299467 RepID=A0A443SIY3_9ACAR|nr:hypothetical protein B4U80_12864 [Leptotrombidium deliense]
MAEELKNRILNATSQQKNILRSKSLTIKQSIGSGSFSFVFLATNQQKKSVAIKIMDILKVKREIIKNEISAMKTLKHANIVAFYDTFEDDSFCYIVMEHCPNGDVFDYISNHRALPEQHAWSWFTQLIFGLAFIHKQGFVHRDIKLENMLLDSNFKVKITDFGFSFRFSASGQKEPISRDSCGSVLYACPEKLQNIEHYSTKADVWSCGVVLFVMLFGIYPLDEDRIKEARDETGDFRISIPEDTTTTEECKELVKLMLVADESRISTGDILKHKWFTKKWQNPLKMDVEYFKNVNINRQGTGKMSFERIKLKRSESVMKVTKSKKSEKKDSKQNKEK